MNSRLVQFSVVVAGKAHNPTILNPDFLTLREIVPRDWRVAQTVTTPPFSMVRYENGLSLVVEMEKLQVVDLGMGGDPERSRAPEIAGQYVKTLPHVRYTAVGVNFQSVMEVSEPESALKTRFLKEGPWDTSSHRVNAAGIRLVYPLTSGRIVLSFDAGLDKDEGAKSEETKSVIIANANFHRECQGYPSDNQVLEHLAHIAKDWSTYQSLLRDALSEEE
jgi:hypothetical protein